MVCSQANLIIIILMFCIFVVHLNWYIINLHGTSETLYHIIVIVNSTNDIIVWILNLIISLRKGKSCCMCKWIAVKSSSVSR